MMAVRENQVVWFWKDGEGRNAIPEPAIVTKLHDDGIAVDLWIFCGHGAQRAEEKVMVREIGAKAPLIRYVTVKHDGSATPPVDKSEVEKKK
jgi:hypothetical protein